MRYKELTGIVLVILILAVCLAPSRIQAQIILQKSAFGIGGTAVSSDSFKVAGTAGLSVIGKAENDDYTNRTGLWYINRIVLGLNRLMEPLPVQFKLLQNYPNPFNPVTHIKFGLPKAGQVKLLLYNTLGQQAAVLWDGFKPAGYHTVDLDARGLASGIYFYRLQTKNHKQVRQMLLLK